MTFTRNFVIHALAPFNFDLTAQIFSNGDNQIRTYAKSKFYEVLRINGNLVLVNLTSEGTTEEPRVKVELKSNVAMTPQIKKEAEIAIKFVFNLDFDLCSFYYDVKDSTMREIAQQLYGLKNPTTPTVFEALVDSIIEQQISIRVAHTIEERLVRKFGETLDINGETYHAYPTAQNLACVNIEEIRSCGLTQRKAEYIYEAAQLIVNNKLDLESLKNQGDSQQIISELDAIRGIGVWIAELTMLRGMRKLDALPADDLGIRRVISTYYCGGRQINSAEAREIAKSWGKWKGLAAFYLIVAEAKGITV